MRRIDGIYREVRLPKMAELGHVVVDPLLMAAIIQTFKEPQLPRFFRLERRRRG